MVFLDNLIHIYVDFLPITTTTSDDDALALLLAMYTIFELSFPKNNRTIRLLYCILHGGKRFLTNTIRLFVKEKQIAMLDESRSSRPMISTTATSEIPVTIKPKESSSEREKISESDVILTRTTCDGDYTLAMANTSQVDRRPSTSLAVTGDQ